MAAIYSVLDGSAITEGLQGCSRSDEALRIARRLARERDEAVHLEDDDGDWMVLPSGDVTGLDPVGTRTISSIRARAVNDETREIAAHGGRLTAEEVEEIGEEGVAWLRTRLGLAVEADDEGGVVLTAPGVTRDDIVTLESEAGTAGDTVQAWLCEVALYGRDGATTEALDGLLGTEWGEATQAEARAECERVIRAARSERS
jgi:hypothetical protein